MRQALVGDFRADERQAFHRRHFGDRLQSHVGNGRIGKTKLLETRQRLELGHAFVGDACLRQRQVGKSREPTDGVHPFVGDLGPGQVEIGQPAEPLDVVEPRVGDPRRPQVENLQLRQFLEMDHAGIGDARGRQAQRNEARESADVGQSAVIDPGLARQERFQVHEPRKAGQSGPVIRVPESQICSRSVISFRCSNPASLIDVPRKSTRFTPGTWRINSSERSSTDDPLNWMERPPASSYGENAAPSCSSATIASRGPRTGIWLKIALESSVDSFSLPPIVPFNRPLSRIIDCRGGGKSYRGSIPAGFTIR